MAPRKPKRPKIVDFDKKNQTEYPASESARALGYPASSGPFMTEEGARWDKAVWVPTLTLGWPPIQQELPEGLVPSGSGRSLFGFTTSLPAYSLRVPKALWQTLDHPTLREVDLSHVEFTPRAGGPVFVGRNREGKQDPIDWSPIADGWRERDHIEASLWLGYAAALTVAQDRAFDLKRDIHGALMEGEVDTSFRDPWRQQIIDGLMVTMWIEHPELPAVNTAKEFSVCFPSGTFFVGHEEQYFEYWTDEGEVGGLLLRHFNDEKTGQPMSGWKASEGVPDAAIDQAEMLYTRRLLSDGVVEYADQVMLHVAAGLPTPMPFADVKNQGVYSLAHMDRPERFR